MIFYYLTITVKECDDNVTQGLSLLKVKRSSYGIAFIR